LASDKSSSTLYNLFGILAGHASYYGCSMLLHRDLIKYCLPFPSKIESHDLWLAICANMLNRNLHTEYISLHRRIHGNNLSLVKRSLVSKLYSRMIFIIHFFIAFNRKIGIAK
jgi:hypothetical protein